MKNIFTFVILLSISMLSGCNNKVSVDQDITTTLIESEMSESQTIESQSIELENTIVESETTTENIIKQVRHGSKSDPIPLGESYTYKFIIPNHSYSMNDLTYGYATVKISSINESIEVDVKFDSCNKDISIQLGREILDGSYFTTVSENLQENILISNDVYTEKGDYFNLYNPIYPGGSTLVYVNNEDAKYLIIHHNVYADDDEINNPDSIEIETYDNVKYELRYYTTWFELE